VSLDAVHADAENGRLDRFERFDFVTEIDGFERSARGGVLGVKVENDLSPGEVLERDFLAVIRDKRERRRFASRFDHLVLLSVIARRVPRKRRHDERVRRRLMAVRTS